MPKRFAYIPDKEWDEAADTVTKEIRVETGIPDWLPTFLNGRREFERRVLTKLREERSRLTST